MTRKYIFGIGIVVLLLIGLWLSLPSTNKTSSNPTTATAIVLKDAHGLAVDRKDSSKVYIATHSGLLMMQNDGELQRVGTAEDDYMGFSAHPTDPNTFYTSGHPRSGGNLGFQKTTDGGKTWQKVSNGLTGPVDFHAMTVSQADTSVVYGVYAGRIQRSNDEGKAWELVNAAAIGNVITLATGTKSKDMVYAGTTDGLFISQDQGRTWTELGTINDPVTSIVVNPLKEKELIAYVQNQGLIHTSDSGSSWNYLDNYTGSLVMQLAYDPQNPATIYLINQDLEIHKSKDSGNDWQKIR